MAQVYEPTLERFRKIGGLTGNSVAEAVRGNIITGVIYRRNVNF
jgi:hypothetical protein